MDRVLSMLGCADATMKPEVLVVYGGFAVLVTIFVNWALSTMLLLLKPFTCAAVMFAFIRPDLAQNILQEECLKQVAEKCKSIFFGLIEILLKLGVQFRQKLN